MLLMRFNNVNPRFELYVVKVCKLSETNGKILFCEFLMLIQTWNTNLCFWNYYNRLFFFNNWIQIMYVQKNNAKFTLIFDWLYIFFLTLNVYITICACSRVGIISITHIDMVDFNAICGIAIFKAFLSFIYDSYIFYFVKY